MPFSVAGPSVEVDLPVATEPPDAPQNRAMLSILQFLVDAGGPDAVAQRAMASLRLLPEVAWATLCPEPDLRRDLGISLPAESMVGDRHLNVALLYPGDPVGTARVRALVELVGALHRRAWEVRMLADAAKTDALTRLSNRRGFEPMVDQALARWQRSGEVISLMLCDIDHFKQINDRWGHHVGDEALVAVSQALQTVIRPTDSAARLGGDEFGILLVGATIDGAIVVAERLRDTVRHANPLVGESLTLSIGIADTQALHRVGTAHRLLRQALFRAADEALYLVKASGRNGFAVSPDCGIPTPLETHDTAPIPLLV